MNVKFTPLIETLKVRKLTDKDYFSDKYVHYVSNSRLGWINPEQGGSPEKFFGKTPKTYSDSLILGSAVHGKVLQSDLFNLVRTRRPTAKLGFVCDYIHNHYNDEQSYNSIVVDACNEVEYYKGRLNDAILRNIELAYSDYSCDIANTEDIEGVENMYLPESIYDKAISCINACNNNIYFKNLLRPTGLGEVISENELAFTIDLLCTFDDGKECLLKLKSKLDNFTIDLVSGELVVNDLKTLGAILPKFNESMVKYHYARELMFYHWFLGLYAKKEFGIDKPTMRANCLVVSTIPQYYTKVYKLSKEEAINGFNEFRELLKLVAYYKTYEGYDFGRMSL